jgi:hypothetical protein
MRVLWGSFVLLLLEACPADGEREGGWEGPPAFGSAPAPADEATARRSGEQAVQAAVAQCGGDCSADVASGRASLIAGNMQEAFAAYLCADTPEAAFGAGISKLLGVIESRAADRVLDDLGFPRFAASSLFGSSGVLARIAARWNGEAQLSVRGAIEIEISSQEVMADEWDISTRGSDDGRRIWLTVATDQSFPPGTNLELRYDCANQGRPLGVAPSMWFEVTDKGRDYQCSLPNWYSSAACQPEGGALRVIDLGTEPGAHVELELSDVRFECREYADDNVDAEPTRSTVTVSGRIAATVSRDVDASDLHPLFGENVDDAILSAVGSKVPLTTLMNHAAGLAGEVAAARCFFDKAALGSGKVFELPGDVFAGGDLALSGGDAKLLGAFSALGAAMLELGTAYETKLPLRQLLCWVADNLDERADCPKASSFVASLNDAWRGGSVRHDRFAAARSLLAMGARDFEQGVSRLDETSAFVANAVSMPAWSHLADVARAIQRSLDTGSTAFPGVTPGVHFDLAAFFASPPRLSAIATPLATYSEDCEDFGEGPECYREVELDPAYLEAFFDATDIDWDGDYEWLAEDDVSTALEEVILHLDTGLIR